MKQTQNGAEQSNVGGTYNRLNTARTMVGLKSVGNPRVTPTVLAN